MIKILFIDQDGNALTMYENAMTVPNKGELVIFDKEGNKKYEVVQVRHVMIQCENHSVIIKVKRI